MRVPLTLGLGGLACLCMLVSSSLAGPIPNPVQVENAQPGTSAWRVPQALGHAIEGYTSEVSVAPGDTLHLHVSTSPAEGYRVEIYRLGWYGGAGGRVLACLPADCGTEQGQPGTPAAPSPTTGLLQADWPVTDTIRVPSSWVSGYYLAVLRLESGAEEGHGSWVPFVVRAPASRQSAILVQAAVNTWQAYNRWGGFSLYRGPNGDSCKGVCTHVSFDRPYDPKSPNFWDYELPLVHFLEENGYDVSYTTDVDTDRDPAELLRHRLVVVAGHDEYWTKTMRDAFDTALADGTNLAFMGADTGYWQMRYADNRREIVEYRIRSLDPETDPALKTVRFRDLVPPRPECELEGVEYSRANGVESIGGDHDYSVVPAALSDPWFARTGFTASSTIRDIVGYEWDAVQPGCRTGPLTVLFHFAGPPAPADAVRMQAPSGALVFSAGSLTFSRGLDDFRPHAPLPATGDPRLEAFMRNAFAALLRPAGPIAVRISTKGGSVAIRVVRAPDPRVVDVRVFRAAAQNPLARGSRGMRFVCRTLAPTCLDRAVPAGRRFRYVVVIRDPWGSSTPFVTPPVAVTG